MERHLLIQECEREEKMKELRKQQNYLIKKGRMVECSRVTAKIKEFQEAYIKAYPDGKYVRGMDIIKKMSDDEKMDWMMYVNAIAFCADIIHSSSIELNEMLKKTLPGSSLQMFETLEKVGTMAKNQILWMDNNVDEKYQDDFARYADEISVMLLSFVKNRFLPRK